MEHDLLVLSDFPRRPAGPKRDHDGDDPPKVHSLLLHDFPWILPVMAVRLRSRAQPKALLLLVH